MRLRKTVIVVDLTSAADDDVAEPPSRAAARPDGPARQVALLARRLGMPVTGISAFDSAAAAAMGRAVRSRRVLIVSARHPEPSRHLESSRHPEPARQALSDLCGVLAGLRDLGLRGDCLAWVGSCDRVDPDSLAALLELGPATGTSIMLSTTSMASAANLAARVATTVACGRISGELARRLAGLHADDLPMGRDIASAAQLGAADANSRPMAARSRGGGTWSNYEILRKQPPGTFTLVFARRPDAITGGLLVPIALTEAR